MQELADMPDEELYEVISQDEDLAKGILCYRIGMELHELADEL